MSEAATIERLEHRIGLLTEAVTKLARIDGARLSRADVCARFGWHRNTLARKVASGEFPRPTRAGDWLLARCGAVRGGAVPMMEDKND